MKIFVVKVGMNFDAPRVEIKADNWLACCKIALNDDRIRSTQAISPLSDIHACYRNEHTGSGGTVQHHCGNVRHIAEYDAE